MLPTFLHIGAPRCGTTWMYECIVSHPEVKAAYKKEIRFFNVDDKFNRGLDWYSRQFDPGPEHKAWGEASPQYISWVCDEAKTSAAKRVADSLPECDLICCLRDPIDRAYSHWKFMPEWYGVEVSFEEAVKNNIGDCVGKGKYAEHLERWFKYFSRDELMVQIYEDVVGDNQGGIKDVYEHIGVYPNYVPEMMNKRVNAKMFPRVVGFLRRVGMEGLVHKVSDSCIGDWLRNMRHRSGVSNYREHMDRSTELYLHRQFVESNNELEKIIGVDLSHWSRE